MTTVRALITVLFATAACGPSRMQSVAKCASDSDCMSTETCNVRGFCQTRSGCRSDAECGTASTCDTMTGLCRCTGDAACMQGQTCNTSGRCQDIAACGDNGDCPMGLFCDGASKRCIMSGTCTTDTQCPLGNICDTAQSKCVAGCKVSGDCPQTTVNASGVTVFAPQGCVGGMCKVNGCTSNQECSFGQKCTANACASACSPTTPYCTTCDRRTPCPGSASNFCLVDPRNGSNCSGNNPPPGCNFFCGVDCSMGQACPSGYECYPIIVVVNQLSCTCNTTCANGTGMCNCNEGATTGFCACRANNDCGPGLTCDQGTCQLGKNCFPSKGLYCDAPGPACP